MRRREREGGMSIPVIGFMQVICNMQQHLGCWEREPADRGMTPKSHIRIVGWLGIVQARLDSKIVSLLF